MTHLRETETDNYFLRTISRLVSGPSHSLEFHVEPEFGEGTMTIYPLFPGFFASVNRFTCRNERLTNGTARQRSDRVLRFEYSLSSGYEFDDDSQSHHSVDAGRGACFSGVDRFETVEFDKHRCDSITLAVYLDRFLPFLESYWGDDGSTIAACFANTDASQGFSMQPKESYQPALLERLLQSIETVNMVGVRTSAVDLLHAACRPFADCPCPHQTDHCAIYATRARAFIEQNVATDFTIEDLARHQGINASYLKSYFKRHFGTTIHNFKKECRLTRAASLLATTDLSVKEIHYRVGYSDAGKFARSFRELYGACPSAYRTSSRSN